MTMIMYRCATRRGEEKVQALSCPAWLCGQQSVGDGVGQTPETPPALRRAGVQEPFQNVINWRSLTGAGGGPSARSDWLATAWRCRLARACSRGELGGLLGDVHVHDAAVGGSQVRLVGREQAAGEAETALGGTVDGARVATLAIASVIVVRAKAPSAVLPVVAVMEPTPELGSGLSAAVVTTFMGALRQASVRIVFHS